IFLFEYTSTYRNSRMTSSGIMLGLVRELGNRAKRQGECEASDRRNHEPLKDRRVAKVHLARERALLDPVDDPRGGVEIRDRARVEVAAPVAADGGDQALHFGLRPNFCLDVHAD